MLQLKFAVTDRTYCSIKPSCINYYSDNMILRNAILHKKDISYHYSKNVYSETYKAYIISCLICFQYDITIKYLSFYSLYFKIFYFNNKYFIHIWKNVNFIVYKENLLNFLCWAVSKKKLLFLFCLKCIKNFQNFIIYLYCVYLSIHIFL